MSKSSISAGPMRVSLVGEDGRTLPLHFHNGRYYVEAVHGLKYTIKVNSETPGRLEVLAGIDGRDTLVNQPADLLLSDGLIISGYSQYVVPGWGKHATTPFIFTAFDRETIAMRATGSNKNLGVIAVACFGEYVRPRSTITPLIYRGGDFVAKGMRGGLESMGMGTGTDDSDVTERRLGTTTFTRANQTVPDGLVEIYAMPKWWLLAEGVLGDEPAHDANHPAGFRRSPKKSDYDLR